MKLEEMEKILEREINKLESRKGDYSLGGLDSLSKAIQALLMVRQEIRAEKHLEAKYGPNRPI